TILETDPTHTETRSRGEPGCRRSPAAAHAADAGHRSGLDARADRELDGPQLRDPAAAQLGGDDREPADVDRLRDPQRAAELGPPQSTEGRGRQRHATARKAEHPEPGSASQPEPEAAQAS